VDHDGVAQLGAAGTQDRLAVLLAQAHRASTIRRDNRPAFLLMGRRQVGAL
jgi:hypothetical protein